MSRVHVYILCFGEYAEGHEPQSAWATLKDALDEAEKTWGVRPTHAGGVQWRAKLDGCDEIYIRRLTVKGEAA